MLDEVQSRLEYFGYECSSEDLEQLEMFMIPKVEMKILNFTNQNEVPEELKYVEIDMVCAEFLMIKKAFGKLSEDVENNFITITSVNMGDTSFDFGEGVSADQRFDMVVNYLMNSHMDDLLRFRRMVW